MALNGLMEPGHTLPNYLDEDRWSKCLAGDVTRKLTGSGITDVTKMIPARPAWLNEGDSIDRRQLFARFRGLLTYGSPLDKFAVLFPATVPLNRDQAVFQSEAEWINIYDYSDPVGGPLDYFGPFNRSPPPPAGFRILSPSNLSVRCWPIALSESHQYFTSPATSALADTVQKWLIYGYTFDAALVKSESKTPSRRQDVARRVSRWVQMLIFFVATLLAFVALLRLVQPWGTLMVLGKYSGLFQRTREHAAELGQRRIYQSTCPGHYYWDARNSGASDHQSRLKATISVA